MSDTIIAACITGILGIVGALIGSSTQRSGSSKVVATLGGAAVGVVLGVIIGMRVTSPPLTPGPAAATTSPPSTPAPGTSIVFSKKLIAYQEYQGQGAIMPNPAGPNQVIIANGDIDNSGTCHIKVFGPGEPVGGLGGGTYQLWLVTGTPEQIQAEIDNTQKGSATHAGGLCPRLS